MLKFLFLSRLDVNPDDVSVHSLSGIYKTYDYPAQKGTLDTPNAK